jgi:hypothetical protein
MFYRLYGSNHHLWSFFLFNDDFCILDYLDSDKNIHWSVTSPFFLGSAFLVAKRQHLALPGSNGSNGAQGDFQLLGDPLIGIDWDS